MMCFVSPLPIVVAGMVFIARETPPFPVEQDLEDSPKAEIDPSPPPLPTPKYRQPLHTIDRNPYYDPLESHNVEMPTNTMLLEGDVKISFVEMLQDMRPFHYSEPTNSRPRNSVSASNLLWTKGPGSKRNGSENNPRRNVLHH
ncbi:hypothetical protein DPMN_034506 [Dreissena polymorpha]|uniref:Uncharacterized protein n=1 Tax=Dreissena polymorpha TaxID=45954 RepID=A0A9D4M7N0_DREPO|nr:hypothetical protein DPMN_034506 [Dreissena polymorpha]